MVYRGNQYSLRELPKQIKLTDLEKKIITARLCGGSISVLDDAGLKKAFKSIISSCIAIYGFFPINNNDQLELISEEMCSFFVNMDFDHMNLAEYHLALQVNAKGNLKFPSGVEAEQVKPTTTGVSVKFVSDVMCLYLKFRDMLDRKFQNSIDGF